MASTSEPQIGLILEGGTTLGLGPAELLGRFTASRDEAAFAAIVAQHGPMVLATCRRLLAHPADADDAFQATFLVFARQARSIRHPDRLAPWLHRVARRVAVRARSLAARRRTVEGEGGKEVATAPAVDDTGELRSVLDEELARLPAKYRAPLVLCYLEGLTHDEAAGQLAWPVGTVRSRLAGGRDRLRSRLARRGFAPSALALLSPPTLPSVAVSPFLQAATVRLVFTITARTAATSAAALLAQGALTSMLVTKVQTVAVATFAAAIALTSGAAGIVIARQQAADSKPLDSSPALPRPASAPPEPTTELIAAQARIKALEAELAARNATTPPPRNPGDSPQAASDSQPQPAAAAARQPEVQQIGQSGLLMVTSTGRDRVTMIEPKTGKRATLQLGKPVDAIRAQGMQGGRPGLLGLVLQGTEVAKLAVFDPTAMRWHEHTLADPVTRANPVFNDSGTWITFALNGPKVTEAPAFNLRSLEWRPDALTGPPQEKVASIVLNDGTKVTQAGPFYYFSNMSQPKVIMFEVKRPASNQGLRGIPRVGLTAQGTNVVRGIAALNDGTLCVQDGDVLNIYHPKEVELTQVDLAAEK